MLKKILLLLSIGTLAFASVDINNASVKELITLKGIGKNKAKAIVAYRKEHCFKTVDELVKIKGIGQKTVEKNRDNVIVGQCNH